MLKSYLKCIEYYLPELIDSNDPNEKATKKIGIFEKRIAAHDEFASDLAIKAAYKLFQAGTCKPEEVEFLLYVTQSPDHYLPTTACILQDRLGLPTTCGALDVNLGCSGFVYGLSLAKGLIETGMVKNVLLITSDTYSKFINPKDRSVKPLFGDGAAATFVSNVDSDKDNIGPFVFGTDGSGSQNLIVPAGGLKEPYSPGSFVDEADEYGNIRSRTNLYMNGPEIFNFTLREIPNAINQLLNKLNKTINSFDYTVFHQANSYMLEHLRSKLDIPKEKFSIQMRNCGNTVSSSIPIALKNEIESGNIINGYNLLLVGFGVGYSWGACEITYRSEKNDVK